MIEVGIGAAIAPLQSFFFVDIPLLSVNVLDS